MFDISTIDYRYAIWILPIICVFHELEELNIGKWHRENIPGMTYLTDLEVKMVILFVILLGFVLTAIGFLIPDNTISAIWMYIPVYLTLTNGLQHVVYVVRSRKYNPGVIFASVFGIPAGTYIIYIILAQGLLPYWTAIVLLALVIVQFVRDLNAMKQNRRPALLLIFAGIGRRLARWMAG